MFLKILKHFKMFDNCKDNPGDLWHLRHWLQFWQLRTWIHDNLCYLTINCDTGKHSHSCNVSWTASYRWKVYKLALTIFQRWHLTKCIKKFTSIWLQWVPNQNKRYCVIRDQLSLTHRMVWGVPYAWERWDRIE